MKEFINQYCSLIEVRKNAGVNRLVKRLHIKMCQSTLATQAANYNPQQYGFKDNFHFQN